MSLFALMLQSEGISLQATSCSEELQCCQSEILELRCPVNALEVERQAQPALVSPGHAGRTQLGSPPVSSCWALYMPHVNTDQGHSLTRNFPAFAKRFLRGGC